MQFFRFSSFRLWPFYPTGINIGSKWPQHVSKHAEKQSETRRVQNFGAKKLCAQGSRANGPPAQQCKNSFESPDAALSNAV